MALLVFINIDENKTKAKAKQCMGIEIRVNLCGMWAGLDIRRVLQIPSKVSEDSQLSYYKGP